MRRSIFIKVIPGQLGQVPGFSNITPSEAHPQGGHWNSPLDASDGGRAEEKRHNPESKQTNRNLNINHSKKESLWSLKQQPEDGEDEERTFQDKDDERLKRLSLREERL